MTENLKQRLLALGCAGVLSSLLLASCGSQPQEENQLKIVSTVYAAYDLAYQLTEDFSGEVQQKLLLTPGGESHSYEPTPMDVAAIQNCDLFIYVGGPSETWANTLIETTRKDKKNIRLFDYVDLLDEEITEGMQAEAEEEDTEPDEHIWTSPANADDILRAIRDGIQSAATEEQAASCNAKYDKIHEELMALDAEAREIQENGADKTLVFADRFPFRYLTDAYHWKYAAAFPGCSGDTDVSSATLSSLITKVKEENIDTVFYLENSTRKIADAICSATDAKAVMMQSMNNVTNEEFENHVHYQALMEQNLNAIREALT
ncbi:MAG: metal ABC transporter substrate-binding protein [Oscillospiraceae bacterium]|nr:metal ABC transporter substrate-binding protein [Oscillospiraceae bacterium]